MRTGSDFDTNAYVRGLTISGLARTQARSDGALSTGDLATRADLQAVARLLEAAIVRQHAQLRRLWLTLLAGLSTAVVAALTLFLIR